MRLTSAMLRVCPGLPKSITLCYTEGVAVLAVSQGSRENDKETYEDHDANADTSGSCQPYCLRD